MRFALESARRGGRYVQIGLAGKPVSIPFDLVCFHELSVTSGFASTPASWRRALELVAEPEGEVGAGPGLDPFRPPAAELRVEIAGPRQVTRVKLEVDHRVGAKPRHRLVSTV